MDTKQSSDLPPESNLREHQRLIDRAITQTAVRHIARQVGRPSPAPRLTIWQLVSFIALLLAAVAGLLVAGPPPIKHPPGPPMTLGNMRHLGVL